MQRSVLILNDIAKQSVHETVAAVGSGAYRVWNVVSGESFRDRKASLVEVTP